MRHLFFIIFIFFGAHLFSQNPSASQDTLAIKETNPFVSGYYPVSFFDFDLKYLIKYNNYEAFRLGLGGVTNGKLFKNVKLGGYIAYGFKDRAFKYGTGINIKPNPKHNNWFTAFYTQDISEIGTFNYLTSARAYSVFEPRLINITQFYKHQTGHIEWMQEFNPSFSGALRLSKSFIEQIEDYSFLVDNTVFNAYNLLESTVAIKYNPNKSIVALQKQVQLPTISAQVTQGYQAFGGDFNYTKVGLNIDYFKVFNNKTSLIVVAEANKAFGDVPLTHLFHASPNSPTKDEILQRFSVAGTQSFETMYFGEFFSSELITLRGKYNFAPITVSKLIKPQFALISKHAVGNLTNPEQHLGIPFNTLNQVYNEAGLEVNQLIWAFGLSFAYRYGFYHLPKFEDNLSFKFTFNLKV